jgi:peptide chain release factor subunit 1
MTTTTLLDDKLRELAQFESTSFPVISLYLNTQTDQHGRTNFEPFLRKELKAKAATFDVRSPELESFDEDAAKIEKWLAAELQPSSNGVAIFACSGADGFFEAIQFEAPIQQNVLTINHHPQLYPLARLSDQYPAYAAVVADTNSAHIFVFGLARTVESDTIRSEKLSRTQVGGWSQARYQRHVDNLHQQHGKEVMAHLERIVREEGIDHIIFAGDAVILPILRNELPSALAAKVVDELSLDINAPEQTVLKATLEAMRAYDSRTDAEEVQSLISAYRSGGLAVVRPEGVSKALHQGQVETLFISATFDAESQLSNDLVAGAKQTGARVRFIEDAALLAPFDGVGAALRYRTNP